VSRARDHHVTAASAVADGRTGAKDKQALLLFRVGQDTTMAVPLALVARIEEFPRERLERAGNSNVVQYRGEVLPLIDLAGAAGVASAADSSAISVIVYSEGSRSVGFVVASILDVVEESISIQRCTSQRGVLGAIVVQGKVTDLLDIQGVIQAHAPWFYATDAAIAA
jgi:two-component system chemotaxis sensor kinase CheA